MSYSKIEIIGLRGYSDKQVLNLAIPNGNEGSVFIIPTLKIKKRPLKVVFYYNKVLFTFSQEH
jgi:hypothetical protein